MPELPPPQVVAVYQQALTDYSSGKFPQAHEALSHLLQQHPAFEDAYEALSVMFYNEKRYDEAIEVLNRWKHLNPRSIMCRTNLSRCYVSKGMILEAEAEQNEARKLTWQEELKSKKTAPSKINFEELIQRYRKVIDLDPSDVLGYFSLGTVYLEAGMKREAIDTFEKAVGVDPLHSASYWGLGQALESLQDFPKARWIYQKGIQAAEKRGDVMTQKKMEARLRSLMSGETPKP